jgi:hypothetical protein
MVAADGQCLNGVRYDGGKRPSVDTMYIMLSIYELSQINPVLVLMAGLIAYNKVCILSQCFGGGVSEDLLVRGYFYLKDRYFE